MGIAEDPALRRLLAAHPGVESSSCIDSGAAISWVEGSRARSVFAGRPELPLIGVVELTDNNPLVCADTFSVPSASATLAVLALGPLAEAGLIVERPTMLMSAEGSEGDANPFLASLGWQDGLTVAVDPVDLGSVVAATVVCSIVTPERLEDIDDLFDERYGRSFFVHRDEESSWDVSLVAGRPHAIYRLRVAPDHPNSLLTIRIMADRDGKCGAAQVVHAFNVMCGFEESLGIA